MAKTHKPEAARVSDKSEFFRFNTSVSSLTFAEVVVDRHRAIETEGVQLLQLTEAFTASAMGCLGRSCSFAAVPCRRGTYSTMRPVRVPAAAIAD